MSPLAIEMPDLWPMGRGYLLGAKFSICRICHRKQGLNGNIACPLQAQLRLYSGVHNLLYLNGG